MMSILEKGGSVIRFWVAKTTDLRTDSMTW